MIIGLSVTEPKQAQAEQLIAWIQTLGGFGHHRFVLALEESVSIDEGSLPTKPDQLLRWTDQFRDFPQTDNVAFRQIATFVQFMAKQPFIYLTPEALPTVPGWIDFIEEAYLKCGKYLMGPRVEMSGVLTMSPIGVYPGENLAVALGEALQAVDVAWPIQGSGNIMPNMTTSDLIQHDTNRDGLRNGAVLYYPDRDGSVMGFVMDRQATAHALRPKEKVERERDSVERQERRAALPNFAPWKSKHESIERIKELCTELAGYCDAPVHTAKVRDELKYAGVVKAIPKRIKRKVVEEKA